MLGEGILLDNKEAFHIFALMEAITKDIANYDISTLKSLINQGVNLKRKFIFAVDFEKKEGLFIENPDKQDKVKWRLGTKSNFNRKLTTQLDNSLDLKPCYTDFSTYSEKFNTIYSGLYRGDSFLANLTIKTPLNGNISLEEIANRANSTYLLYVPDSFVCFSPETFIKIDKNQKISSFPMKGTISADVPNAEESLLSNPKEIAEHHTIVDLIRSDLSRVATNIKLERFRYIDKLSTIKGDILQVSSEITGDLLSQYSDNYGDLLLELLPAGSICGSPKVPTVELITKAEGEDRGYYCGVFGYFDGCELDSAVMIRFIEKVQDKFFYRSGGGITINSDMQEEYQEVNTKIYVGK